LHLGFSFAAWRARVFRARFFAEDFWGGRIALALLAFVSLCNIAFLPAKRGIL